MLRQCRTWAALGAFAAIDLGIQISASLSIDGVQRALQFKGPGVLKGWDYLGRQIAAEQSCIAGTRGGDPERAPFSRAISRIHQKRRLRLEHAWRCIGRAIAERCLAEGVSMVHLGYPKGITREVDYGSKWNGRIAGFWSFDRALAIIEQTLRKVGIASGRVGERGTSSHCPACGSDDVRRSPRWRLTCRACGEVRHADQAGSRNILKFQTPSACWDGPKAGPQTETRRWNLHRWTTRSANPRQQDSLPEFLQAA